jgi:hypothetical protein
MNTFSALGWLRGNALAPNAKRGIEG